jgi:hypothetical protein
VEGEVSIATPDGTVASGGKLHRRPATVVNGIEPLGDGTLCGDGDADVGGAVVGLGLQASAGVEEQV